MLPTYFISHGGGPWPWVPAWRNEFRKLEASLARIPQEIAEKPSAVLVVSGHWEGADFAIMSASRPGMVYDYHGFPADTYRIFYPAPGAPAVAERTADLIRQSGLPVRLDDKRGFDHGAFVPLFVMYPEAETPVFQLSLQSGYDPLKHSPAWPRPRAFTSRRRAHHRLGPELSQSRPVWPRGERAFASIRQMARRRHGEPAGSTHLCCPSLGDGTLCSRLPSERRSFGAALCCARRCGERDGDARLS